MSNERERELKEEQVNELKAFRKIGEALNVLGIEMIVAGFDREGHYSEPSMKTYYVKDGKLHYENFDHSELKFLKLQNKEEI